ncbi:hypothetical protein ACFL1D_05310 [Candidatus Omnitrophota bacterium]
MRTILLVPDLNKAALLKAIKNGKMYVLKGKKSTDFILDSLTVSDASTGAKALMGEEVLLKDRPRIGISGNFLRG